MINEVDIFYLLWRCPKYFYSHGQSRGCLSILIQWVKTTFIDLLIFIGFIDFIDFLSNSLIFSILLIFYRFY